MATVPMYGPDGMLHDIPAAQVKDALAQGGEIAHAVKGPDGLIHDIPTSRLGEAMRAGGVPIQNNAPRTAPAQQQPGFVESLGQSLGAPTSPEQAASLLTNQKTGQYAGFDQPAEAVYNVLSNVGQGIAKRVMSGAQQIPEAIQNIRQGGPVMANVGKAFSGMADIVGATQPTVNAGGQAGQQVSQGNYRGALGSATGGILTGMAAGLDEPAKPPIPKAQAVETILNSINPVAREMPTVRQQLGANLDAIAQAGVKVSDRASLAQATQTAAQAAHDQFQSLLAPVENTEVATFPGYQGPKVSDTRATLGQLYSRLSTINATLNPRYAKGGVAAQAALDSEQAVALTGEAAKIRNQLYSEMGKQLSVDPQAVAQVNQRAGSLRDLADTVQYYSDEALHNENAANRAPGQSDITIAGVVGKVGKAAYKGLRGFDPDRMINSVFSSYQPGQVTPVTPGPPQPAPPPRSPIWLNQGIDPSSTPNPTFYVDPEATAQAQAVQRGNLNFRANTNARNLEQMLREKFANAAANRATHGRYKQ